MVLNTAVVLDLVLNEVSATGRVIPLEAMPLLAENENWPWLQDNKQRGWHKDVA